MSLPSAIRGPLVPCDVCAPMTSIFGPDLARFADASPDTRIGPLAVDLMVGLRHEERRAESEMFSRHGADIVIN